MARSCDYQTEVTAETLEWRRMAEADRDAALVRAAQGGDTEAFATLVTRHRPLLRSLCLRALGDPVLAEDAAQEAILHAFLSLGRLRQADRFGAWLAGIGLNVCRRSLRQRAHDAWSWDALIGGRAVVEPVDTDPEPDVMAEVADLRVRVRWAVAGLPPGQRAAVMLFYLAGLTHAETAAQLGVEVGAVKTRLHKARRALRRELWVTWQDEVPRRGGRTMVEMRVRDVFRRRPEGAETCRHVVLLEEVGGERRLPIWVGEFEATAVALHLEQVSFPRPLTYAFAASLLEAAGGRVREVRIERLVDETFYASVRIAGPSGEKTVEARPSDALNLGLLAGAPIRVDPAVLVATAEGDGSRAWDEVTREAEGAAVITAEVVAQWGRHAPPPGV